MVFSKMLQTRQQTTSFSLHFFSNQIQCSMSVLITLNDLMSAHSLIRAPPKSKIFEISAPPPKKNYNIGMVVHFTYLYKQISVQCLRRLRSDLLNPKFGRQKSALLRLKSHNFSKT